jgi:hypothetical protein
MRDGVRALAVAMTVCLLGMAPTAAAVSLSDHSGLQRYFEAVSVRIADYRAVLKRLDHILSEQPMVNVDPTVEKLYRVADQFDRLGSRWHPIEAPKGLKIRHRGMAHVFELLAEGWRIYAAGLFTRHADELHAAITRLGGKLRSADYLQKRWAAALRGSLIRSDIPVPKWLYGMATEP